MNCKETIKVLLLEDDADDYRLIERQLRDQRYVFVINWVETLAAAIEKLDQHLFDIVLTDLSVPDSRGFETVSMINKHCGQAPLIVLTGMVDEDVEKTILKVGAQDYLVKGQFDGNTVTRAVLHAVQRQQSLNEVNALVSELEQSKQLLQQQTRLLGKKNRRLRRLYKTAQEFVDNVSHDFRTPLTVIKDYAAIIREGMVGNINDEQRMMLDKVIVGADDLNNMVDDLLDVSRLESGLLGVWRRNVQVKDIVKRVEPILRQRAEARNVELVVECESDLPDIYCDADKAGRVITNLAVNAIKFAGEPGFVRLWAEADPAGSQVLVGVTDNGPGINKDSLEDIFERFRQLNSHAKSTVTGFGLGLNIARQFCRLNLGEINVQSEVGNGSTFSFTIPTVEPREILCRWLTLRGASSDSLLLIEVAVDDDVNSVSTDELDNFLYCLLRSTDLLVRIAPRKWLLTLSVPLSESDTWFRRAEREFERHNRNRPTEPLPNYRWELRCNWNASDALDSILQQFDAVVRQISEEPSVL